MKLIYVLAFIFIINTAYALDAFPPDYQKKRLIISTDIGGDDKDDTQSMIHFLFYADMFDIEGIIISRPRGHVREMKRVLTAYRKDYRKLKLYSNDYPSPNYLKSIVKKGAKAWGKSPSSGYSKSTPGSRLIVSAAKRNDPRPLYILCWGSTTDVAQAIHDAPRIRKKIKLYAGGTRGYNYDLEPSPTDYLRNKVTGLRWIDASGAGRGLYWNHLYSERKYGNVGFVKKVLRPSGRLGRLYYRASQSINVNPYGIKMGDTVSLLFLMNGSFKKPWIPSWGGRYCRVARNRFSECPGESLGGREGGQIVDSFRLQILKDWEDRINRLNIAIIN